MHPWSRGPAPNRRRRHQLPGNQALGGGLECLSLGGGGGETYTLPRDCPHALISWRCAHLQRETPLPLPGKQTEKNLRFDAAVNPEKQRFDFERVPRKRVLPFARSAAGARMGRLSSPVGCAPLLHCGLGKCEPKKRFMGPTLVHTSSLNDTQCAFVGMAMPPACAGAVWGTFREGGGLLGLQQRKGGGGGGGCSLELLQGGGARGHGVGLFAFGGAYWPLATAHSDPLGVRTCFGRVNGAPG